MTVRNIILAVAAAILCLSAQSVRAACRSETDLSSALKTALAIANSASRAQEITTLAGEADRCAPGTRVRALIRFQRVVVDEVADAEDREAAIRALSAFPDLVEERSLLIIEGAGDRIYQVGEALPIDIKASAKAPPRPGATAEQTRLHYWNKAELACADRTVFDAAVADAQAVSARAHRLMQCALRWNDMAGWITIARAAIRTAPEPSSPYDLSAIEEGLGLAQEAGNITLLDEVVTLYERQIASGTLSGSTRALFSLDLIASLAHFERRDQARQLFQSGCSTLPADRFCAIAKAFLALDPDNGTTLTDLRKRVRALSDDEELVLVNDPALAPLVLGYLRALEHNNATRSLILFNSSYHVLPRGLDTLIQCEKDAATGSISFSTDAIAKDWLIMAKPIRAHIFRCQSQLVGAVLKRTMQQTRFNDQHQALLALAQTLSGPEMVRPKLDEAKLLLLSMTTVRSSEEVAVNRRAAQLAGQFVLAALPDAGPRDLSLARSLGLRASIGGDPELARALRGAGIVVAPTELDQLKAEETPFYNPPPRVQLDQDQSDTIDVLDSFLLATESNLRTWRLRTFLDDEDRGPDFNSYLENLSSRTASVASERQQASAKLHDQAKYLYDRLVALLAHETHGTEILPRACIRAFVANAARLHRVLNDAETAALVALIPRRQGLYLLATQEGDEQAPTEDGGIVNSPGGREQAEAAARVAAAVQPSRYVFEAIWDLEIAAYRWFSAGDEARAWGAISMRERLVREAVTETASSSCGALDLGGWSKPDLLVTVQRSLLGGSIGNSLSAEERLRQFVDLAEFANNGFHTERYASSHDAQMRAEVSALERSVAVSIRALDVAGQRAASVGLQSARARFAEYRRTLNQTVTLADIEARALKAGSRLNGSEAVIMLDEIKWAGKIRAFTAVQTVNGARFFEGEAGQADEAMTLGELGGFDVDRASSAADLPEFDVAKSHALYRQFFGRTDPILAHVGRLYLVGRGASISPALLVVKAAPPNVTGDARYAQSTWLLDRFELVHLRSIASLQREVPVAKPASTTAIIFRAPALNGPGGSSAESRRNRFQPRTSASSCGMASLSAFASDIRGMSGRVDNQMPTEANYKSLARAGRLSQAAILATFTHGELIIADQEEHEQEIALALAPTPGCDKSAGDAPLIEDGFLTPDEIASSGPVPPWIVLAGCLTATRGTYQTFDLPAAFFTAGAQMVVGSIESVPGDSTGAFLSDLMRRQDSDATDILTAVTRALRTVKRDPKWSHPAYWGSWQILTK